MDRVKKLKLNAATSLVNQIVILISGLILPRLILDYYGSATNGLVASIGQFLSIVTFLDMGVGAVVQSALFKPLAQNDEKQISLIIKSASNYFRKIAYALVVYIIFLMLFFPNLIQGEVNHLATAFLILAMSLNRFAQYYFGIVNELLLNADQKAYVQLTSETVTVIINIFVTILLIINNFSIVTVKLATGLIYLSRPVSLKWYVDKNYNIDLKVKIEKEPLEQKWNGIAQHTASVVLSSTDTIILSLFSTLETVSIYSVYNMVVQGIKLIILSLITGVQAFFGNLLANNEFELLNSYFTRIEWLVHTAVTYLFGMTAVLITPFVLIYTQGIEDTNYNVPTFALIIVLAQAAYSLRLPYNSMVLAAGHYRETQASAIIEVLINIVFSITVVSSYGLIGIAIGTLLAMVYRTIYLANYLSKNIVFRPIKLFIKHSVTDLLTFSIFLMIGFFVDYPINTFTDWIFYAIILGVIFFVVTLVINLFLYKETTIYYIKQVFKRI